MENILAWGVPYIITKLKGNGNTAVTTYLATPLDQAL